MSFANNALFNVTVQEVARAFGRFLIEHFGWLARRSMFSIE